jgi:hypothetical protein
MLPLRRRWWSWWRRRTLLHVSLPAAHTSAVDTGGLDWIKALLWVFRSVTGRSP